MKIHSRKYEILFFSVIFFSCIAPPFMVSARSAEPGMFSEWNLPVRKLALALFAGAVLVTAPRGDAAEAGGRKTGSGVFRTTIAPALVTLCALLASSAAVTALSSAAEIPFGSGITVNPPQGPSQTAFCIMNFMAAAFYEEVIYRFYFPDALRRIFRTERHGRTAAALCETAGLAAFAAAHSYLGAPSVINAAAAHITLRLCMKRTHNIRAGTSAHFLYNLISLYLLRI